MGGGSGLDRYGGARIYSKITRGVGDTHAGIYSEVGAGHWEYGGFKSVLFIETGCYGREDRTNMIPEVRPLVDNDTLMLLG